MTWQEKEREAWEEESKCYDIAGSVRPLVTEYWLSRIASLLAERSELIRGLIKSSPNLSDGYAEHCASWNSALDTAAEIVLSGKTK